MCDVVRDTIGLSSFIHLMPDKPLNPVLSHAIEAALTIVCLYTSVGSLVASLGIRPLSCLGECLHEAEKRRFIFLLGTRTDLLPDAPSSYPETRYDGRGYSSHTWHTVLQALLVFDFADLSDFGNTMPLNFSVVCNPV